MVAIELVIAQRGHFTVSIYACLLLGGKLFRSQLIDKRRLNTIDVERTRFGPSMYWATQYLYGTH